ncbi:hypothetical protein LTR15_007586 [Elasticomyces elasticus]|nr:hypothetical protein LTR15_007586 [Elasticomyces elasticus]
MELQDRVGLSTAVLDSADSAKRPTPSVRAASEESGQDVEDQSPDSNGTRSSTGDALDMHRMGKDQVLVRHFRQLSMTSFLAIANPAWEIGLFVFSPALQNGGRPMLVWSLLWNFICFGPIYFSLAEMASMAPIAGAQYHWVSGSIVFTLCCTSVWLTNLQNLLRRTASAS